VIVEANNDSEVRDMPLKPHIISTVCEKQGVREIFGVRA
jgi:hypothetical protein